MLNFHAAFYKERDGWYVVSVLDFPGVNTQAKNLREARWMVQDALKLMAEVYLDEGKPLPYPNPKAHGKDAAFIEEIGLETKYERRHTYETPLKRHRYNGTNGSREG